MVNATSAIKNISGRSKVTLPHEEAIKAPFPPGCKVLCFDENGFRVGVVKDVLVFISLHEQTSYGTYYEVDIKGAGPDGGNTSVFTAADLRLTPDCPVTVNPEYFGSIFEGSGMKGKIEGIVLGSFELPPRACSNCSEENMKGKFFYSVRVKFPGVDEVVEAHGVPPEFVMVSLNGGDIHHSLSMANESILLGGGSYGGDGNFVQFHDEMRSRNSHGSKPPRRVPEEIQGENEFDNESVRDGYYQQPFDEDSQENIKPSPQKTKNVIAEKETGSEREHSRRNQVKKTILSPSNRRSDSRSRQARSVSRTREYVPSESPRRNTRMVQNYGDYEEQAARQSHTNRYEQHDIQRDHYEEEQNNVPWGEDNGAEYEQNANEFEHGQNDHFEEDYSHNEPPHSQFNNEPRYTDSRSSTPSREINKQTNVARVRNESPLPQSSNPKDLSLSKPASSLPGSVPVEGCYLIFDESSGGRFITQFCRKPVDNAIGFWAPGDGKKLQGFKFTQNQGRSDLMKDIAGKDYKKKYYSGWCQFVKAASSMEGCFIKYSDRERIPVDIYVFFHETNEIAKIEDVTLFDVSEIGAIACVAQGNNTFNGVKYGEYGTFINKGAAAGASLALL